MKRALAPRPVSGLGSAHAEAQTNPFVQYIASLPSERSRATMLSVLKRAAQELARLDGLDEALREQVTAESYAWGAPGALTFARVNLVVAAIAEAKQRPLARLALSAMRGIARMAFNLKLMTVEERQRIDDAKAPKLSKSRRGRALTSEERRAIYAACASDETARGRRDAALIAAMLGAGLRRFEAAALDLDDFTTEDGLASLRVREGKGDQMEVVRAPPDAAAALLDWLAIRGRDPGPLFWSSPGLRRPLTPGSRLTPAGVYAIVLRRAEQAGLARTAPHDLRRSMITDLLERTGDLAIAQRQARHSSPATTAIYDKRGIEAIKKALSGASTGYKR